MQPAACAVSRSSAFIPNSARPARRSAAARARTDGVDPRRPAPRSRERLRLHRVLHAVEREEHDRHGRRRAATPTTSRTRPTRSTTRGMLGPNRRTDARTPAITASATCSCRWASASRRSSSSGRRCRSTSAKASTSTVDGELNDPPSARVRVRRLRQRATPKDIGACETVNCGRGAQFTQLNLRVSRRRSGLGCGDAARSDRRDLQPVQRDQPGQLRTRSACQTARLVGGAPNAAFMQPTRFCGRLPAARTAVGQIGFRFTF